MARLTWVVQVMNMLKHSFMSQNIGGYICSQKVENVNLCMADLSPLLDWAKRTDSGSLIDSSNKYEKFPATRKQFWNQNIKKSEKATKI